MGENEASTSQAAVCESVEEDHHAGVLSVHALTRSCILVDVCRVCRMEASSDRPLFYPCLCTGSIKYVHQEW